MDSGALMTDFYKPRSLAGRLSAGFKFVNANFKYLFKRSFVLLLPLVLVWSLLFAISASIAVLPVGYWAVLALVYLFTVADLLLFYSFIVTSLKQYVELGSVPVYRLKELWPLMLHQVKKLFFVCFFSFLCCLFFALIVWLGKLVTPYTCIVTVPLVVFLFVPLSYFGFRFVFEREDMGTAFKKSYRLGISYWGSTFAMLLISAVLAGFVQLVASLPLVACLFVQHVADVSVIQGNEAVLPGFFPVLLFFLAFVSLFISFISMILNVVLMAFQYGSIAADKQEKEAGFLERISRTD